MNQTEKLAYNWLLKQGYTETDIVFRRRKTPDFICSDGSKFEVKRLYGNSISFGTRQLESIKQAPDMKILVFVLGEEKPRHVFAAKELIENEVIEGIKINTQNEDAINISEIVKQELEELKTKGEFKSLDAVIRHYISSFVEINGGIFLGSEGGVWNNIVNVRRKVIKNNYTNYHLSPPETIRLNKCLKCGAVCTQEKENIVPTCLGCNIEMTPITIFVGTPKRGVSV